MLNLPIARSRGWSATRAPTRRACFFKDGIQLSNDSCFDFSFTVIDVSEQFWADANTATPTISARIPSYVVFNMAADVKLTKNLKLIAGISDRGDEKYYSRVFFSGSIEPAPVRSGYAGLSLQF